MRRASRSDCDIDEFGAGASSRAGQYTIHPREESVDEGRVGVAGGDVRPASAGAEDAAVADQQNPCVRRPLADDSERCSHLRPECTERSVHSRCHGRIGPTVRIDKRSTGVARGNQFGPGDVVATDTDCDEGGIGSERVELRRHRSGRRLLRNRGEVLGARSCARDVRERFRVQYLRHHTRVSQVRSRAPVEPGSGVEIWPGSP